MIKGERQMDKVRDTIMIIDDDSRNIFALSLVLRSKGFNCISASGAREGLRIMAENKTIGIILMDMMMPEMDGYEAMAQLRADEHLKDVPVIAVTAQAMAGDREKCLNAGAVGYISKPVDVDALLVLLKKYLS